MSNFRIKWSKIRIWENNRKLLYLRKIHIIKKSYLAQNFCIHCDFNDFLKEVYIDGDGSQKKNIFTFLNDNFQYVTAPYTRNATTRC